MDFYQEITTALERGFFKELNSSIKYSPLKFFIHLNLNMYPERMNEIRQIVRDDIEQTLVEIDFYQHENFFTNNGPSIMGNELLKQAYNLGIFILKEKLTVKSGFKLMQNQDFRSQVYIFILGSLERAANKIINKG